MYFLGFFINFLILINASITNSLNLCNYISQTKYNNLKNNHPELIHEFDILSKIPLPIWYTDRDPNSLNNVKNSLENCNDLINIVIIYGLPNKDCEAGQSSAGSNKNSNDYNKFLNDLQSVVQNKEIIYIIEPDALNFLLPNKCGLLPENNYKANLIKAIEILSQNNNAKIYLDIGYWNVIYSDEKIYDILNIVNELDPNQKSKGFSLNLSNYRKTDEMITACDRMRKLSNKNYHCIIDTSRNYNGPSTDNQWCNLISAGIGKLPTSNTNYDFIDYLLWLKPQTELDGNCLGFSNSYQTQKNAGDFDLEYFKMLWNQGIFHNELNQCK